MLTGEGRLSTEMLHARTCEAKKTVAQDHFASSPPAGLRSRRFAGYHDAQSTLGNQAMLRRLDSSARSPGQLQRQCACGGSCSGCRAQNEPATTNSGSILAPAPTFQRASLLELEDKYSDAGVLMTLAGSGTCVNTGAESVCNPDTGIYEIPDNSNTCCTRDCSQKHEMTHVEDDGKWGCCKALAAAVNAAKDRKEANEAIKKYNHWLKKGARALTDCNAYRNDVACADDMAKKNDCEGAGRDTDCCKDIADYRETNSEMAYFACTAAPNVPPPCPAF